MHKPCKTPSSLTNTFLSSREGPGRREDGDGCERQPIHGGFRWDSTRWKALSAIVGKNVTYLSCLLLFLHLLRRCPFRTTVPFWWRTSLILSSLSWGRDCRLSGLKQVFLCLAHVERGKCQSFYSKFLHCVPAVKKRVFSLLVIRISFLGGGQRGCGSQC